jgi:hypothetical protein
MEPFFEQYPVLLIPLVIVIVEAWNLVKSAVRRAVRDRQPASDRHDR